MTESAPLTIPEDFAPATEPSAEERIAELQDRLRRLQADHENFRKRKAKEAEETRRYALGGILRDILPILDHFELALDATHDRTAPDWGTGIDLIVRQMLDLLKTQGLAEIAPAPGDVFDHSLHEAIATERNATIAAGCITRATRKGYQLKDRLLRAAQVVIAETKSTSEETEQADV